MVKKYVLTGGPCTGKSTTLQSLGKDKYQIVPEVARIIIDDEQLKKGKCLPWIDREKFQEAVLKKQLELEEKLKDKPEAFLDRGIPDGIAYYKLDKLTPPKFLIDSAKSQRYDGVFLLRELPQYEKDLARKEDIKIALKIQKLIKETYKEMGYHVIEVPSSSVEERKEFIKKFIEHRK